jgi:hypothetical protein
MDHRLTARATSFRRLLTCRSIALMAASLMWIERTIDTNRPAVGWGPKCCLMTWEKDCPPSLCRDSRVYASMSMVMVFTAMHLSCTYTPEAVKKSPGQGRGRANYGPEALYDGRAS